MMKRLIPCVLAAMLALSGCAGNMGAGRDSASGGDTSSSSGATRTDERRQAPATESPWANDPHFIAPPG